MHLLTQESPCWLEEGLFFLYAAEASEAKENRVQHSNPRVLYTRENVQKQARLGVSDYWSDKGSPDISRIGVARPWIRVCHRATAGDWIRGVLEQYVAGSDT
jgi:hypothetical protein